MPLPDPGDLASLIHTRFECLDALVSEPRAKTELVDALDIPRSTLDDIVRELEQAGLVEYDGGLWRPTHSGRTAYRVHREYLQTLDSLGTVSSILDILDAGDDVPPAFIDEADVFEPEPHVKDAGIARFLDRVADATRLRIVTPCVVNGFDRRVMDRGTSGDTRIECIAPAEVYEWLSTASRTATKEVLDDPHVTLLRAAVPFSFGLSIIDGSRAVIIPFTDQGVAGLLFNDTDSAVGWAETRYERVKADAEPVDIRGRIN